MTKWFLLLFLFSSFCLSAQSKKIVVVVDTVSFEKDDLPDIRFRVWGDFNPFDKGSDNMPYSLRYPNYTSTCLLENDSSVISIPVDDNGAIVKLQGAYTMNIDTIKINHLKIRNARALDSTFSHTFYYKVRNGVRDTIPYKTIHSVKIQKEKHPTKQVSLTVNGRNYTCELSRRLNPSPEIINGHGHIGRPYRRDGSKRSRYKKFDYFAQRYAYPRLGYVRLSEDLR